MSKNRESGVEIMMKGNCLDEIVEPDSGIIAMQHGIYGLVCMYTGPMGPPGGFGGPGGPGDPSGFGEGFGGGFGNGGPFDKDKFERQSYLNEYFKPDPIIKSASYGTFVIPYGSIAGLDSEVHDTFKIDRYDNIHNGHTTIDINGNKNHIKW